MIHAAQSVYTEYTDPRRDEWQTKILPALKRTPLSTLEKETGLSRRTLVDLRAGRSRPHPRNQELIAKIFRELFEQRHSARPECGVSDITASWPQLRLCCNCD